MNTSGTKMIFPQLVLRQPRPGDTEPQFRGVSLPAEEAAQEVFYRGLPCVGWVTREACRASPEADSDKVLRFSLATLRESVPGLVHIATDKHEDEILRILQKRLTNVYGEMTWSKPREDAGEQPPKPDASPRRRKLVLVVEDDPVTRHHLCQQLRQCGFDIHATESGADALLMGSLLRPDLVLLDLHMDGVNGRQTCAWLKESRLAGNPPVIFISADHEPEAIRLALAAGGADFLRKPFNRDTALPRIAAVLGDSDPQPPAGKSTVESTKALNEKPSADTPAANTFSIPVEGRTSPGVGLRRTPTDLAEVLPLVIWILAPLAKRRQVHLELDAPASGLVVSCDELRIQYVLEHLLAKAIKAAAPGNTVTLSAHVEANHLTLSVNESGCHPPRNADSATTQAADSAPASEAGIREPMSHPNFEMCRQIAAAHDGVLHAHDRGAEGTDYFFSLPTLSSRATSTEGHDLIDLGLELAAAS